MTIYLLWSITVILLSYFPTNNGFWLKSFAIQRRGSSQSVPFTYDYAPESCPRRRKSIILRSTVTSTDSETKTKIKTKNDVAPIVAAGGRAHTETSRAKISAANKGKIPWNVGKKHSEETKKLIAQKTKEAMYRRKVEKAEAMGMSVDEMVAFKQEEKRKTKELETGSKQRGITDEGRKRISESLKRRWESPEYRVRYSEQTRGKRNHSIDTRARISEKIRLKWQDKTYRMKIMSSPSSEVRARISATLKARWEDPIFREKMLLRTFQRTDEWKSLVAEKIRLKWADPAYRAAVEEGIRASNKTLSYLRIRDPNSPRHKRATRIRSKQSEAARLTKQAAKAENDREKRRQKVIKVAKKVVKESLVLGQKRSIKELLGSEIWFEEKLRRTKSGSPFTDDDALEALLLSEWTAEADTDIADESVEVDDDDDSDVSEEDDPFGFSTGFSDYDTRDGDLDGEKELDWFGNEDDYLDLDEQLDEIEVYDEHGELVGTYTAGEFEKIRGQKK